MKYNNELSEIILTKLSKIQLNDTANLIKYLAPIIVDKENNVGITLSVPREMKIDPKITEKKIITTIRKIPEVNKIVISFTNEVSNTKSYKNQENISKKKTLMKTRIAKKVIAIVSGKGGVGKSTISTALSQQLALKIKNSYKKIALVDADIYGPSIPQMFDITTKHVIENNRIIPIEAHNVLVVSTDLLIRNSKEALAWRGPMASKALYQMLSHSSFPELEYLVIDMPPGTGDVHLSLLSNYIIDGVIIVTTPQQIATNSVNKSIDLYKKFNINIYGVIENMSYYEDHDKNQTEIFTGSGANNISSLHNIPILATIPLQVNISKFCDRGKNIANLFPDLSLALL